MMLTISLVSGCSPEYFGCDRKQIQGDFNVTIVLAHTLWTSRVSWSYAQEYPGLPQMVREPCFSGCSL
jgi:hypothetical protein